MKKLFIALMGIALLPVVILLDIAGSTHKK